MLCIFEKILTRNTIDAGIPIMHGTHQHDDFEKTIDELNQIFNPWRTDKDFLPFLASWVAFTLQEDWSEYQQRKLISEMVSSIYRQRGLKQGLYTYLDIYAMTNAKPRIAIDDGDAIFRATFLDDGTATLHAVAHSNTVSGPVDIVTVLLHPSAIAVDKNNNYIVADQGDISFTRNASLWKISSTGEIGYTSGTIPMPSPIDLGYYSLDNPTAVVIDKKDRYCVVKIGTISSDSSINSAIYRFEPSAYPPFTTVIDSYLKPRFAVHPVDMILDRLERFVILDRGLHPLGDPPQGPAQPQIVVYDENEPNPSLKLGFYPLNSVEEPTALVMDSDGGFIVADAKDQSTSDPANLIRFDSNYGSPTTLLDIQNPLIFPTGLIFESPQSLLVCDAGVRWGFADGDITNRIIAEPAAIYRVDVSQIPSPITRVTYERKLVNPTKMMIDRKGKLIIADHGESLRGKRNWRADENEFGVVVHFSQQLHPTTQEDRKRIRLGIMNVIEEQKPGDTS
jgi:phage tail-like protein